MEDLNSQLNVVNIERTLHHFYNNDVESQAQANKFLIIAQTSPEAWQFAWQLLDPSKASEVQFFGASTLHAKISKQWSELPTDHYDPLRERLLVALFTYASGPRVISTRLCIAMSSFVIQTITEFWPNAVSDLISAFQPQNIPNASPQQIAHVLLELLTVLSEEFQTTHLPQAQVGVVRNSLRLSLDLVMNLAQNILSKTDAPAELCEMSLKCYSSWAMLGPAIFEHKSLLLLAFDSVYRDEISQTALETLMNVSNHPESNKYSAFVLEMVEHVSNFDELIKRAAQDYDMEKLNCIYGLIIGLAENHCHMLLETILDKPEKKDKILKIARFILECSSTPGQYPIDEICSEQAFGFWYTLQDAITSTTRGYESLLLVFHPIFQSLLDAYTIKLRYPSEDVYKQWKSDEKESFRCYRQDIGDSIMYCYNILRNSALANLIAHLDVAVTTISKNASQWQYLEACLFAFKEIAESVDIKETQFIPVFMSRLRNVPLQNIRIISATMEAIGAFAEWINVHSEVLGCVIPLLLMGLQSADVAVSATFALKDISRDCYSSMRPFAEQILQTCLESIKGSILKSREKVRIVATIGKVLSIMPYQYIMNYLDSLLPPVFTQLEEHLTSGEMSARTADSVVHNLHVLSMLFSTLDTHYDVEEEGAQEGPDGEGRRAALALPQPALHVLAKLLETFSPDKRQWRVTEQITEALCDALKRAVSILSDSCKPYLDSLLTLLLYTYRQCPHAAVLDMTKQVLVLFLDDKDQQARLSAHFSAVCDHTIQLSMQDFRESTTVIESFLQVLEQIVRRTIVFFRDDSVNHQLLFQFGVASLSLPEKPTVKAAAGFLAEFIAHSREVPNMLNVVNCQGEVLVMQVLKVIGGDAPRPVVEYMPDILMAFNKKYFDNLCRWLVPFTQQEGFPSPRVTQAQKEDFSRLVLKERTNKRRLRETVTEFSLMCRGLIGTEYAAQSYQSLS